MAEIQHHPLVEALASDPDQPKRATRLFGFPGPSAERGSTRLWLDLELTSYLDVPDDAILHHRTLDDDRGTVLWVDPEATLKHSAPREREVQAEFLEGEISGPGPGDEPEIPGMLEIPHVPLYRTMMLPCPTDFPCESFSRPCGSGLKICFREPPLIDTTNFLSKFKNWCVTEVNREIGPFRQQP